MESFHEESFYMESMNSSEVITIFMQSNEVRFWHRNFCYNSDYFGFVLHVFQPFK